MSSATLSNPVVLLSLIIFLPAAAALVVCFLPKAREDLVKLFSFVTTVFVFLITVWMAIPAQPVATVTVPISDGFVEAEQEGLADTFGQIEGVKGVKTKTVDGQLEIAVHYEVGQDANEMNRRVEDYVARLSSELPSGVGPMAVRPFDVDWDSSHFSLGTAGMQKTFTLKWIPTFNINYTLGVDGISFPLILLTSFLGMLSMAASWPINKHIRGYCALFLLLEAGMLGVFLSLDFFLFYVFWEVMLLPMYFLIGVWGGPKREYAAIKFFLFTLVGSVLMLVALLMLYFASDVTQLSPQQLHATHVLDQYLYEAEEFSTEPAAVHLAADQLMVDIQVGKRSAHTFNLMALAEIGQLSDSPFGKVLMWGKSIGWFAFLLLFVGFAVKLPAVPIHTWLPDAHVEAPTPISMILAGVLLKMGGYGILRICYPICPQGAFNLAWLVCGIGLLSMIYGAFAAMAQTDFKRLVAYSSVSHMGYVLLGIGVWSAAAGNDYNTDAWTMGLSGAMFQMIAHGLSSAGMFFLVGVIYERVHHRDLNQFGGLFSKMPVYGGLSLAIFFAGMGLPGLCGFWGEIYVVLGVWPYAKVLAVLAAFVVILTAGYILWTIQRVYLGPEYKGPHAENIVPMTRREVSIAAPLVILAVLFGVYPRAVLDYITPTISQTAEGLAEWQESQDNLLQDTSTQNESTQNAQPESAEVGVMEEATPTATPVQLAWPSDVDIRRPDPAQTSEPPTGVPPEES